MKNKKQMKKKRILRGNIMYIVMLFAVTMIIWLPSCNKENEQITVSKTVSKDVTTEKILAFKAKMEQGLKADDFYTIDSAVWYIEAALNYTYCMHTEDDPEITDYVYDSLFLAVTVDDVIPFETVSYVFEKAGEHTQDVYESISNPLKDIIFQDVEFKDGSFVIYTMFGINTENNNKSCNHPDIKPYNWFTAMWPFVKEEPNDCPPGQVPCKGFDGITLMKSKANYRIPRVYGYYTDIVELRYVNAFSYPDEVTVPDGGDYEYYFYVGSVNCLSPEELNFYTNGMLIVAENLINNHHSNALTGKYNVLTITKNQNISIQSQYDFIQTVDYKFGVPHYYDYDDGQNN